MKYKFNTKLTVYGYIEAEIGDRDPEEYAQELEEMGVTTKDLTFISNDEVEINDWDKS